MTGDDITVRVMIGRTPLGRRLAMIADVENRGDLHQLRRRHTIAVGCHRRYRASQRERHVIDEYLRSFSVTREVHQPTA